MCVFCLHQWSQKLFCSGSKVNSCLILVNMKTESWSWTPFSWIYIKVEVANVLDNKKFIFIKYSMKFNGTVHISQVHSYQKHYTIIYPSRHHRDTENWKITSSSNITATWHFSVTIFSCFVCLTIIPLCVCRCVCNLLTTWYDSTDNKNQLANLLLLFFLSSTRWSLNASSSKLNKFITFSQSFDSLLARLAA